MSKADALPAVMLENMGRAALLAISARLPIPATSQASTSALRGVLTRLYAEGKLPASIVLEAYKLERDQHGQETSAAD